MELIQAIVPPLLRHARETEIYSLVLKLNSGPEEKKRVDLETVRLFAAPQRVVLPNEILARTLWRGETPSSRAAELNRDQQKSTLSREVSFCRLLFCR